MTNHGFGGPTRPDPRVGLGLGPYPYGKAEVRRNVMSLKHYTSTGRFLSNCQIRYTGKGR